MFSNNLLDNISDMVVTAERKGNTFVVTDITKGENEKECESSTELLKINSRTAEMIVVADRNGNTIVVKDNVVPSMNNENEKGRCNNRKYNNNEEDNIDDDGSNSTVTTLSTIISAVKSLSLSTSSSSNSTSQTLQSELSPKLRRRRRRNRITIATFMTGRRRRKLFYLFKIKSNSDRRSLSHEEKNVSTDELDRLLHSSLSTTSSFDSYKCLGKTI